MIRPSITIRDETPADIDAIYALTAAAFKPMPFSNGSEPEIINRLRRDGDLTLSLVAEQNGVAEKDRVIVGQITFSPVRIESQNTENQASELADWYGLGPVAVAPTLQKTGIGSALIRTGLARIKSLGTSTSSGGCVLVGNPAYYSRFGFRSGGLTYGDVPREYVQWLSFGKDVPKGEVRYAAGFGG